jgi:hypothetical protein
MRRLHAGGRTRCGVVWRIGSLVLAFGARVAARDSYELLTSCAARLPDSMAPFIHPNQVDVCSPAK